MAQVRQHIEYVATRDTTDLIALGRFVRTRRRTLELTQDQLAERLGWVQERISLLENGKYGLPSLPSLALLASAVECELGDVLVSAGYECALESSEPNLEVEAATHAGLFSVLAEWAYLEGVEPVSARMRHPTS